jgi:GGDEF domain-containing protein
MAFIRTGLKKLASILLALTDEASSPTAEPSTSSPRPFGQMRAASSPTVMAGSIQLLGMAEIKQQLGAGWSGVADFAYRIAEQTIRRHISTEDSYQRLGGETFVLCFASPDKAHAEAKTREIVQSIATRLAQQAPQFPLRVDHTVAEVEWADIDQGDAESIAEQIARELRQVRERSESSARAWRNEMLRTAGIRFGPIWHPPGHIVSSYRTMLNEQTGTHALQRLAGVTTPEELTRTLHELDCLIVGRGIKALDLLLHAGGMAQMLVPVNFNSLSNRTAREKYLNLCRDIPQHYKRFLLFEVHGAPNGTPISRLLEIALSLKPYGHGVLVEMPASGSQLQELASVGLFGLSVDAKSLPRSAGQATAALMRVVSAAAALHLKVFVHGADTVGILDAARKARADYVDGRAVALPMAEPKSAYRWTPR